MVIFESKIKKTLRLSKYLFFILVGTVLGFAHFEKEDSKAIFGGLSINPSVAHAEVPTISSIDFVIVGSDTPDSGVSASSGDSDDDGSCSY